MNNPFYYLPDAACEEAFEKLMDRIENLKKSSRPEDINFCREIEAGKMLGVLIAADDDEVCHTLYAFSGQLGDCGFNYQGFVDPVFDYLQPNGYFRKREAEISRQNAAIKEFENGLLSNLLNDFKYAKEQLEAEVRDYKDKYVLSKLERKTKRDLGVVDEDESVAMIRQSQFEKAELRRVKKRVAATLEPFASALKAAEVHLEDMKEKRRSDSEALQQWLFSNFRLLNARGEWKSLREIFAETSLKVPPSGAGECCGPKLLQAAYLQGLKPVSMAEYWYGKPKGGEVRKHGHYYPACRGKCLPILTWMLEGLDVDPPLEKDFLPDVPLEPKILYENEWFCVVDKPSGMLSVPGKGEGMSVQRWLEDKYGEEKGVKVAHRLDQDTSGVIIATFGNLAFKIMQTCFATRRIKKIYVAELEGDYQRAGIDAKGCIELPLLPDYLDRPRQRIDFKDGKEAVTEYEFIGVKEGKSRVMFYPKTGRTHQLRVHSAAVEGLGMPIVGDRLYGKRGGQGGERLHLHAQRIEFVFPIDNKTYRFESPVPF